MNVIPFSKCSAVLFGLFLLAGSCKHTPHGGSSTKVFRGEVGKDVKDPNDPVYKSTVSILVKDKKGLKGSNCTGAIIDPHYVLTAAHCVRMCIGDCSLYLGYGYDPLENKIRTVDALAMAKTYGIADISTEGDDYALFYVKDAFLPPDHAVVPISDIVIPSKEDHFVQAGYGSSLDDDSAGGDDPLFGKLAKVDDGRYYSERSSERSIDIVHSTRASVRGGDSGGPLYRVGPNGKLALQGILRSSGPTSEAAFSARYTNAVLLVSWIKSLTSSSSTPMTSPLPQIEHEALVNAAPGEKLIDANSYRKFLLDKCESTRGWSLKVDPRVESVDYETCMPATREACHTYSLKDFGSMFWSTKQDFCLLTPETQAECEAAKDAKLVWKDERCQLTGL